MTQRAAAFKAREQAILDATEHLLLDSGDEAITIEMIAERVGIAKGTIYKHFQSKDELILQVLIAYEMELATVMAEAVKSQDIHQLIQSYFVFRLASPEKHLLFERLENKLAATRRTLRPYFARLYFIRKSYLRQAFALNQDAEIVGHLAEVLMAQQRTSEARQLLDEALKRDPQDKYLLKLDARLRAEKPLQP